MEIIKKGNLPGDKVYQCRCGNCSTVVSFKRSEAKSHYDRNEHYLVVHCPVCGNSMSVNA